MVRKYKPKREQVLDKDELKAAVLSVRCDKMSVRKAAELHGCKWTTLSSWLKKTNAEQAADGNVTLIVNGRKTVRIFIYRMICSIYPMFSCQI